VARKARKRDGQGRFRKGQSGNPGGRPRSEISLTALLREALAEFDGADKETKARKIVDALVVAAIAGNVKAIEHAWERIDGPADRKPVSSGATEDVQSLREYLNPKPDPPG
jgi:Family of unknown function (DUF5681)